MEHFSTDNPSFYTKMNKKKNYFRNLKAEAGKNQKNLIRKENSISNRTKFMEYK